MKIAIFLSALSLVFAGQRKYDTCNPLTSDAYLFQSTVSRKYLGHRYSTFTLIDKQEIFLPLALPDRCALMTHLKYVVATPLGTGFMPATDLTNAKEDQIKALMTQVAQVSFTPKGAQSNQYLVSLSDGKSTKYLADIGGQVKLVDLSQAQYWIALSKNAPHAEAPKPRPKTRKSKGGRANVNLKQHFAKVAEV